MTGLCGNGRERNRTSDLTDLPAQMWALLDSDQRPLQCECNALPTELSAHI